MDEYIELADGTQMDNTHCIESDGSLFIYTTGRNLDTVYTALRSGNRTRIIRATQYGEKTTYEGYTHLYALREEGGGMTSAALRKG